MTTPELDTARAVLETAADTAEEVVQLAAERAAFILAQHAEEKTESIAERAATKAIDGFFLRLGVDTKDPIAMQKDFAHLRAWRESVDLVKRRGIVAATTVIVTGGLAMLYAGFSHRF